MTDFNSADFNSPRGQMAHQAEVATYIGRAHTFADWLWLQVSRAKRQWSRATYQVRRTPALRRECLDRVAALQLPQEDTYRIIRAAEDLANYILDGKR